MPKWKDRTGKKSGKLTAIEISKNKDGEFRRTKWQDIIWICQCQCGRFIEIPSYRLSDKNNTKSCGKCNYKDITGFCSGKLTVKNVLKDENGDIVRKNNQICLSCICECGNTTIAKYSDLTRKDGKNTKSCGRCKEIKIGQKFGKLVMIERVLETEKQERRYKFLCECGNILESSTCGLRLRRTKSCGKCNYRDLAGQKFGKLIVIEVKRGENNKVIKKNKETCWMCLCECGNITEARAYSLTSGTTKSCGCSMCSKNVSQNELAKTVKNIFKKHIEQNYRKLKWLKNSKTKYPLEIDIYIPELKLAIEYDGQQHFRPVNFGGMDSEKAKKQFKETKKLDKIKNRLINNHIENDGNDIKYFIRFNYKEKLTKEFIIEKLRKNGCSIIQ